LNAISNIKGDGSKPTNAATAVANLSKQSHDEHAEIDAVLKRIDGKIDVIKTNVNVLKGRH
jgi:ribosomal protein L7/L12